MSSGNGSEGIAPTSIATVALGEGRHAHDRIDGMRERLDWHVEQLSASIAGVESNAATRAHENKSAVAAVGATAEATAAQVVVLSVRVDELIEAIGPEPSARESLHDLDEETVAGIASRGMRGQLAALWATQIAERAARNEETKRRRAAEVEQTKAIKATAKAQGRSASLLGGLVVLVTTLQETGALRALLAAIRAALGV